MVDHLRSNGVKGIESRLLRMDFTLGLPAAPKIILRVCIALKKLA